MTWRKGDEIRIEPQLRFDDKEFLDIPQVQQQARSTSQKSLRKQDVFPVRPGLQRVFIAWEYAKCFEW